jgi:3',5'-cyclic AMP phosphodiesterase CpdA
MSHPDPPGAGESSMSRRAFVRNGTLFLLGAGVAESRPAAMPRLRIGLITDLHFADRDTWRTRHYRETLVKLEECVERFNAAPPAFAVELGDFIDAAETVEEEIGFLRRVEAAYARLKCPRHYVLGNHCVSTLTKQQFRDNCGAREPYYSFDEGGFHFVVLDACYRADGAGYEPGNFEWTDTEIPPPQREWLAADLASSGKPALVFVHQRVDVENHYAVKSATEVRRVLEESGRVLAVFHGHSHQNEYRQINGIHYCTLAALIEGSGPENNAYGVLSLFEDGTMTLEGFRRQQSYRFTRGQPGRPTSTSAAAP